MTEIQPEVTITRTYKNSGIITKEEAENLPSINAKQFPPGVRVAHVTVGSRVTKNLQNYESCQMHVEVTLPVVLEELNECYDAAQAWVEKKLGEQVQIVDQYIASRK